MQGNIIALQIKYRGAIHITDNTPDSYVITANNNKIILFPIGQQIELTDLFDYVGEFRVLSVLGVTPDKKLVNVIVNKQIHHPEYMNSKPEDMTLLSEEMNADYVYEKRVSNTKVDNKIIKNLKSNGQLYLEDGSPYSGAYHIMDTGKAMTGSDHTKDSQGLYIKKIKSNKIKSSKISITVYQRR